MSTTATYTFKGYQVEIVHSGAAGWFDFYINGKPWGCARVNKVQQRVREVIALKESTKHVNEVIKARSSSRYTQRCQMIEEHGRLTSEEE